MAASSEAYSGPCQDGAFCEYNEQLKAVNCFHTKVSILDASQGSVNTSVLKLQVLFIKRKSSSLF